MSKELDWTKRDNDKYQLGYWLLYLHKDGKITVFPKNLPIKD